MNGFVTTSDGVRLHYLEAGRGNGQPILFVPGLTMPAEIWERQISYFAKTHHVVAMDPRSQGGSDHAVQGNDPQRRSQDIKEVIDALKLSPVVLVAWSMAGPEALIYVDRFGTGSLRGVVIVDSFIGDEPDPGRAKNHNSNVAMIRANRTEWTRNWVQSMFAMPQPQPYLENLIAASLKTPTEAMVALILNTYVVNGDDRRPTLQKLNRPVLYAARPAMRSQANQLKAKLPSARVEFFEGSGHALFVEESVRFNNLLADFIGKL